MTKQSQTAQEHRAAMLESLIDSAEAILRADGAATLTAAAVARGAGIARNSIYRYVGSVDDLRQLVLERYLPLWKSEAFSAIYDIQDPAAKILGLVDISLCIGSVTGHQWLIDVTRGMRSQTVMAFHRELAEMIFDLLAQLDPVHAGMNARIVRGLIFTGFHALDDGVPLDLVRGQILASIRGLEPLGEAEYTLADASEYALSR